MSVLSLEPEILNKGEAYTSSRKYKKPHHPGGESQHLNGGGVSAKDIKKHI